jgi:hypothetical protein
MSMRVMRILGEKGENARKRRQKKLSSQEIFNNVKEVKILNSNRVVVIPH